MDWQNWTGKIGLRLFVTTKKSFELEQKEGKEIKIELAITISSGLQAERRGKEFFV